MTQASGIDIEATTAHLCRRIREAEVLCEPWPHLVIDGFLPDDVFEALLGCLHEDYVHMRGGEPRSWIATDQGMLEHSESSNDRYWRGCEPEIAVLSDVFQAMNRGRILLDAVRAPLGPQLRTAANVFRERYLNRISVCHSTRLMRDTSAYDLRPHTDAPVKLVSIVLYVRADAGERLGTLLYRPKDPAFRCEGNDYHDMSGFLEAKEIPFKPNSAFVFVRDDHTFHGVGFKPAVADFARITVQMNLFSIVPNRERLIRRTPGRAGSKKRDADGEHDGRDGV